MTHISSVSLFVEMVRKKGLDTMFKCMNNFLKLQVNSNALRFWALSSKATLFSFGSFSSICYYTVLFSVLNEPKAYQGNGGG